MIKLREWSRMAEDLQQERNRLSNRVREQLWRYYAQRWRSRTTSRPTGFSSCGPRCRRRPKPLALAKVVSNASLRPTASVESQPPRGCGSLRQQLLTVAAGTAEAASAHIRAVAGRLKLVNRQIKEAHRYLDAVCTKLTEGAGRDPGGAAARAA